MMLTPMGGNANGARHQGEMVTFYMRLSGLLGEDPFGLSTAGRGCGVRLPP